MAAGRTYDASTFAAAEELYNVKSGYRMAGGANLYVDDLSAQEKIPPLTPLYVVADNTYAGVKNAYVVRNARVQANFTADGTLAKKIRIEKGSFWKVGDKIAFDDSNYGTIQAIVTKADYDEVEFADAIPLGCNFSKGDVLFPVTVTDGGSTTVTIAHQAVVYEAAPYENSTAITSLKIVKGSGIVVPENGTLTVNLAGHDIVISGFTAGGEDDAFDTITIGDFAYSVPLGAVLSWETSETTDTFVAERTANYLAYAPVKVEAGASVTLLGRAFEIDEDKLYIPVTDADKASLGDRFMFI